MSRKTHLAQTFYWSKEDKVEVVELISAGIGMAGPVLLSSTLGSLSLGLAASIGSLAVSGVKVGSSFINHAQKLASAMISVILAAIAALLFVGHGWLTSGIFILLATFAAIIGGYGHSLVVATTRFNIFLTIFINMFGNTQYREELLFSIIAGAIGTSSLSLVLGGSVHRCIVTSIDAAKRETISQKITR